MLTYYIIRRLSNIKAENPIQKGNEEFSIHPNYNMLENNFNTVSPLDAISPKREEINTSPETIPE